MAEPPAKKFRSDVWKFYERTDDGKKVKCILCSPPKELVYHGGTSNLRDHVNRQRPLKYKPDTVQTSLEAYGKKKQACSDARAKQITELIVRMVALDLRPMRLVEGKGFLELMAFLEPGYKVPSSAHISTLVKCKHSVAWNTLKEILSKEAVAVGLTTDIWTSSLSTIP